METYFAVKRRLFGGEFDVGTRIVRDRRRVGAAAGRRRCRDAVTVSLEDAAADWSVRRHVLRASAAPPSRVCSPAGEAAVELPLRGRFNAANALVALACGHALGLELDGMAAALADGAAGAGARAAGRGGPGRSPSSSTTRTSRARSRTCCTSAREMASGPGDRRVRRGRRPRPRQAPADGRDRRAAGGRRDRHLRQPAVGGSGGDHRRDPRGSARGRDGRRADRRPARGDRPGRRAAPRPGDVVVIAGKGHEHGQEFAGGRKEPFDDVDVAREALGAGVAGAGALVRRWPAGGRAASSCAAARPAAPGPGAGGRSTPARSSPATCSSACRASAPTAARSRRPPCGRARGACSCRRLGAGRRPPAGAP